MTGLEYEIKDRCAVVFKGTCVSVRRVLWLDHWTIKRRKENYWAGVRRHDSLQIVLFVLRRFASAHVRRGRPAFVLPSMREVFAGARL